MHKPVIRWVGGKQHLVNDLEQVWRGFSYHRLIEPFAGAASFFVRVEPDDAVLVDTCEPLINFMRVVRNHAKEFARLLIARSKFYARANPEERDAWYYDTRERFNDLAPVNANNLERAVLFLLLNRTGFHGLWRVNNDGQMNTPCGHYVNPRFPTTREIYDYSLLLNRAKIRRGDFRKAFDAEVGKGDLIYCDPPYLGTFDAYSKRPFTHKDHVALAECLRNAVDAGADCITTNRDCDEIRALYPRDSWLHVHLGVRQRIAPNKRGKKPEVAIVSRMSEARCV